MLNGRAREMGLGSVRFVGLAEARAAAAEAMALYHMGEDPIEVRRMRQSQIESAREIEPKNDQTALYRHFDVMGRLLYVGISRRAFQRFCEHEKGSRWWLKIARVTIEHFGSRRAAEEAEMRAIKLELPVYNKRHRPRIEAARVSATPCLPTDKPPTMAENGGRWRT